MAARSVLASLFLLLNTPSAAAGQSEHEQKESKAAAAPAVPAASPAKAPVAEQGNFDKYMNAYLPAEDSAYSDKWMGKNASFRSYMDKYSSSYGNYTKYTSQYGGKAADYGSYVTMYQAMAGQQKPADTEANSSGGNASSISDNFGSGFTSADSGVKLREETQSGGNENLAGPGKGGSGAGKGGGAQDYSKYYSQYMGGGDKAGGDKAGGSASKGQGSGKGDYSQYTQGYQKYYQQYMGGNGQSSGEKDSSSADKPQVLYA